MTKKKLQWKHYRAIGFVLLGILAVWQPPFAGLVVAIVILALTLKWLLAHLKKRFGL